jgi:hypothetical protein
MGNCLDRSLSDDEEDILEDSDANGSQSEQQAPLINNFSNNNENIIRTVPVNNSALISNSTSRSNRHLPVNSYSRIISGSLSHNTRSSNRDINGYNIQNNSSYPPYLNGQYLNNGYTSSSLSSNNLPVGSFNNYTNFNNQGQPVYYLTPNVQRTADQLTEEEQIKLLKRMALIQQLPSGLYDETKKNKE